MPVLTIPAVSGLSSTYLIRLQLTDTSGAPVSNNVYWYSTTADVLGKSSSWYKTSVKTYANLTGLNGLGTNSGVTASAARTVAGGQETVSITLANTSGTALAFFLRPEVTAGDGGREVVPVDYTDNYLTLWPGEQAAVTARYQSADLGGQQPFLRLRGYNIPTSSTRIP